MIKKFDIFFLTFFLIGKIKFAPGTLASLVTTLLFLIFVTILNTSYFILFIITLVIFFYSFVSLNNSIENFTDDDPHEIVIDEVAGQLLTLLSIPIFEILYPISKVYYCLAAFILFRIFDIWKPFPISYIDNNVKGALGIMIDDIVASIFAISVLTVIFFFLGG